MRHLSNLASAVWVAPIGRVGASSLANTWAFVQRSVDGDVAEVEPDDPVIGAHCLCCDGVEDPCGEPFVASLAHCGIGHLIPAETLGVLPRAARGDSTSITLKESRFDERGRWQPSGCSSPTKAMSVRWPPRQNQTLGVERAHDVGDLYSSMRLFAPDITVGTTR